MTFPGNFTPANATFPDNTLISAPFGISKLNDNTPFRLPLTTFPESNTSDATGARCAANAAPAANNKTRIVFIS